ncbi:MAG: hypothetical protein AAB489_02160 [Patescibacteria group bacterium]
MNRETKEVIAIHRRCADEGLARPSLSDVERFRPFFDEITALRAELKGMIRSCSSTDRVTANLLEYAGKAMTVLLHKRNIIFGWIEDENDGGSGFIALPHTDPSSYDSPAPVTAI